MKAYKHKNWQVRLTNSLLVLTLAGASASLLNQSYTWSDALRSSIGSVQAVDLIQPVLASTVQFGSTGDDVGQYVVVDDSGIYIAGDTTGSLASTNTGLSDVFLRKYTPSGTSVIWEKQFGSTLDDFVKGLAVDSTSVYVVGKTLGSIDATHMGSSTTNDAFFRKYDLNGNLVWGKQLGTAKTDEALWVVTDNTRVCWGGGTLGKMGAAQVGMEDAVVQCYSPDGTLLWTKQFGTTKFEESLGGALSADGLYVTGATGGKLGPTNPGGTDIFYSKLTLAGVLSWSHQFGSPTVDFPGGIDITASRVFLSGRAEGALPGEIHLGNSDSVIAGLPLTGGQPVWKDQVGTANGDTAEGISIDPVTGNVFFVGVEDGTIKHGPISEAQNGFVRAYSADGQSLWHELVDSGVPDQARDVTIHDGTVYVVGGTEGVLNEANQGLSDAFLIQYELAP